jgi:hypothetical protein
MALTPNQEARDAVAFGVPRSSLSMAAQLIYDQLVAGGDRTWPLGYEPPVRFASAPEKRREILEAIARTSEKYARPFDKGRVASVSMIGTDSWSDYGAVVLQMAILDTLLSIEEKLASSGEQG